MKFLHKTEITPRQKQKEELIDDLHTTQKLLKQAEMMFHMSVDENLIEARIYQMKSLAKHQDYLIASIRRLESDKEEKTFVNV